MTAAQAQGRRRYGLLDGLRAIAALMVVGYHVHTMPVPGTAWLWDGGAQLNAGVAVFFVLSGFLLYRPFVAARLTGSRTPSIRRYLTRRVLRVVPGYWVAITALGLLLPLYVPVFTGDWPIFYGLAQTWVPGRTFDGLSPAWSLSVEAAFYLVLPLYAAGAQRLLRHLSPRAQARAELAGLGLLAVAALVLRATAFDRGDGPLGFLLWSLLGHLDWFAAGLALAVVSVLWEGRAPRAVRLVERFPGACWAGALVVFVGLGFVHGSPGDVVHILTIPFALLLVLPAVFGDERSGVPRRFLRWAPIRWLGVISYGIFLWNEPLASFAIAHGWGRAGEIPLFLLVTAAATALGALSFYLVERPAMRPTKLRIPAFGVMNAGSRPRPEVSTEATNVGERQFR